MHYAIRNDSTHHIGHIISYEQLFSRTSNITWRSTNHIDGLKCTIISPTGTWTPPRGTWAPDLDPMK